MNYEIEITRRCNYKCPGCNHLCNIVPDPSSDMTSGDVASIVDQINALDPSPGLIIVIGGEPTIHPKCVEFCRYIKDNLRRGGELLLDTNFSHPDVCSRCEEVGFKLRDYKGSRDPEEVFRRKADYHFNVLLSPKDEHQVAIDPKKCNVLNGLGGSWSCGMSIHRYRGSVRWCWCPGGSSICKLLQREEFMFPTLEALFNSDVSEFRRTICPHCQYLARPQIMARDSAGRVSACFRKGLEALKQYVEEAKTSCQAELGSSVGGSIADAGAAGHWASGFDAPRHERRQVVAGIPDRALVLGYSKNPSDAESTVKELARVGLRSEIFWNIQSTFQRFIPSSFMTGDYLKSPAHLSSHLGHYHVVKSALDRGFESLWVVEDDVRFLKDVTLLRSALSSIPKDADFLILDGEIILLDR